MGRWNENYPPKKALCNKQHNSSRCLKKVAKGMCPAATHCVSWQTKNNHSLPKPQNNSN